MPSPVIRMATHHDVSGLVSMVHRLASHHGDEATLTSEILEQDMLGPRPWIDVFVAEVEGTLVGYAALSRLIKLQHGLRGFEIHHLLVEERFRGRGIGRGLIDACCEHARLHRCATISVGTHPDNLKAQEFYLAVGFARRDREGPRFSMAVSI